MGVFLRKFIEMDFFFIRITASTKEPVTTKKEVPLKNAGNGSVPKISSEELRNLGGINVSEKETTVSITVVGASGDLAKKKIFPALFALYYEDCLPEVWFVPSLNFNGNAEV